MSEPKKAREGQRITRPVSEVVRPACGDKTGGNWFCVKHQLQFVNQFAKDTHISHRKGCALAWVCYFHGPEVP